MICTVTLSVTDLTVTGSAVIRELSVNCENSQSSAPSVAYHSRTALSACKKHLFMSVEEQSSSAKLTNLSLHVHLRGGILWSVRHGEPDHLHRPIRYLLPGGGLW
jgi:hypothetical protein